MRHYYILIVALCLSGAVSATHLRSGQIIVEQIIPGSLTVKITIQVWTNTSSTVLFGGDQDILQFGDGTSAIVPEQASQPAPGLTGNFGLASYSVQHTYQGYGEYMVSFREPNRNEGIINISNSVSTTFYLESYFRLLEDKAYKSPIPLQQPIFISHISTPLSVSIAASDKNDFALKYVTVVPRQDVNSEVTDYHQPPSFNISEYVGLMTWDNVFQGAKHEGEYLFTARVEQYQWTDIGWLMVGYMYRDFQIIVIDNGMPTTGHVDDNITDEDNKLYSGNGESNSFKTFAYHESGESVTTEVVTELPAENIAVITYDSTHLTENISVTKVSVTTTEDLVRTNPFVVSVRTNFTNGQFAYAKDLNFPVFTSMVDFFEPLGPLAVDAKEMNITFVPNPMDNFLSIIGKSNNQSTISFINTSGENIIEVQILNSTCDVSQLPPGLYYVILKDHNRNIIAREKMIKQ